EAAGWGARSSIAEGQAAVGSVDRWQTPDAAVPRQLPRRRESRGQQRRPSELPLRRDALRQGWRHDRPLAGTGPGRSAGRAGLLPLRAGQRGRPGREHQEHQDQHRVPRAHAGQACPHPGQGAAAPARSTGRTRRTARSH
ncbi:MAG: hypothetical protein ABSD78_09420, partial [Acidimicrobiales bacterium]